MNASKIKKGELYSDGKEARVVINLYGFNGERRTEYASSKDNFVKTRDCTMTSFARWAKYPCTFELQVD